MVETGPQNDNAILSKWRFADEYDADAIFFSATTYSPMSMYVDYSRFRPKWLSDGFVAATPHVIGDAQRVSGNGSSRTTFRGGGGGFGGGGASGRW
ncbi:hypothetical protein [Paraburkholderia caribensis]|uniref:hypothetical protein n=1 Tax=Paraburkholderia caribensis TaxID=75105 RepID=UPI0007216C01|nr:hypothetical protein [Paraburkholderia caribensis]ALP66071.1 hypothetical protein AN416_26680 [Paraburkholderia caribensis]AUT54998.1 hypothetical protein C2L66_24785 [Paraburkholderia caribensis]